MSGRPAAFLDRDGTIVADPGYLRDPDDVRLMPGAAVAIARLNRERMPVVVVTNQSGIGRGYFTEAEFQAVQRRVIELLGRSGARVDAVYHCPHAPDAPGCRCRKPLPGLFERAAADLGLDLAASLYIGDRPRDVEPGLRFGGRAVLVGPAAGEPDPPGVPRVPSIDAAVDRLLGSSNR